MSDFVRHTVAVIVTAIVATVGMMYEPKSDEEEVVVELTPATSEPVYIQTEELAEAPVPEIELNDVEIAYIARLAMAEAEGESELGRRLVIDTVLNRVEDEHFPDTVAGVIFQDKQFTPVRNGRFDRCHATDENVALVKEEMMCRTNRKVIFFNAGHYSKYGNPLFQEGGHYFSEY